MGYEAVVKMFRQTDKAGAGRHGEMQSCVKIAESI